ncbi:HugZ family protein [Pseudothauera nasutitermitis]|uniref:HugZ family protein n=1 Tax=Pseudothauera nasutitermitis TaxID=2565930 RepID=A0A4S4ALX2_9RHOO|nr:pyridoxamine 5'-phosphate oxidase family protein [Pseudothauera nasutitermitis]THF60567.1 HugZ family protein [Pseudothauera nasutitermitis]
MHTPDPAAQLAEARTAAQQLLHSARSLILASIDEHGAPLASYAPFALDEHGDFLIAVSGLAAHGRTLAHDRRVSVLLIEDEGAARQIFARRRLNFACTVDALDAAGRTAAFAALEARFGSIARLLDGLPDFSAYRLRRGAANFVLGFGAAFASPSGDLAALAALRPEKET